ncbi:MAG: sulfate transporter CysZ [Gammaproteobacteria bacterium]|nr:sulfate transporter CysZ [Gammaproteobacteria bacterium]
MILNIFKGFGYSIQGLKLISQPGLRRFVAIPLAINITLFSGAIYLLMSQFDNWLEQLMPNFPGWLSWLEDALLWILWPMFAVMIFFLVFYTFTFIANLIAAPFNSLLAEKTELYLRSKPIENTAFYPKWQTIKKSIASEMGKLFYLLKWSVIILIISFIPVINVAAPALWILFGAWMLALEYIGYPMENHGQYFKEINQQAISRRTLSLGFGSGVFLLTSIPVINFIAMPSSVAGATALWVKQQTQSNGSAN